jgi:uncharacterized membrane protein
MRDPRSLRNPMLLALFLGSAVLLPTVATRSTRSKGRRHRPDDAPKTASRHNLGPDKHIATAVTIARPSDELFAFWRDFTNLPKFMEKIDSVRTEDGRTVWMIRISSRRTLEVATEVTSETVGKEIAWRSVADSEVDMEGKVRFRPLDNDRGTVVWAEIAYHPKGGDLGYWLSKAFHKDPKTQGRRELKRFKMLMETGEVATARFHPTEA